MDHKAILVGDLAEDDFVEHEGKIHLLNTVGIYKVIMNDMVNPDDSLDNRNCTFNKHSSLCTIHLKFTMNRDSKRIEYIGSLPQECPPILSRIEYDTVDGGNIYIKANTRGILAKGLKANKTYILTMLGWLKV